MAKRTSGVRDVYPNRAFESVQMSAANTLTFSQIQFGVGLFQGVAAVIHRVEWYPDKDSIQELLGMSDTVTMALTNRDDLAALDPRNQSVLASMTLIPIIVGAVVSLWNEKVPFVSDFANLPGGGLIVPANPLYAGMVTAGAAAASYMDVIVYLTFKELADADYVELIQTIMPANL
jgi:hypothetical protein